MFSIRALARKLNVSHPAVLKAIRRGRLASSVRRSGGRFVVVDESLALKEWDENRGKPAAHHSDSSLTKALALEKALQVVIGQFTDQLVRADQANREQELRVRSALLNIPARICEELAAEHDASRIQERLEAELQTIFHAGGR